ncbi:MAG: sigma-70 family RNA polymerase sigma factor [Phycisphaerae bacterium]|nr:sigma-70 family RNA polymerase sigma factor [Phycisphaerae bacterium]
MYTTRGSLLVRIKDRRDQAAWREFDAIYRPMLYRFATARGLDHARAEDVVQQCMVVINHHINSFDYDPEKGRFKGWLRIMVNNRIRNLIRDRHDQVAESKDFKRDQRREQSPEEIFDKLWMEEHLDYCLRLVRCEVKESTFKAFQLHVIEERPVEEVGKELNMTTNQVYRIKWRVTQKLSEKMKELLEGSD